MLSTKNEQNSKKSEKSDKNIKSENIIGGSTNKNDIISQNNKVHIHNNVINVIKQENKDAIIVDHNIDQMKFTFYDADKNLLGTFTSLQLLKFINYKYSSFFQHVEMGVSYDIIKKYILDITYNDDKLKILLVSHFNSPFMGNVEMLVKLYNDLTRCEVHVNSELNKFLSKDGKFIEYTIKQLYYLLLNHTLKIIASVSDAIKDDESKSNIKETLLKYSVGIVYKITNLIKNEINLKTLEYQTIQDDIIRLGKIKLTINEKMNSLYSIVEIQNKKIDNILVNINELKSYNLQTGGGSSSNSSHENLETENSIELNSNFELTKSSISIQKNIDTQSSSSITTESEKVSSNSNESSSDSSSKLLSDSSSDSSSKSSSDSSSKSSNDSSSNTKSNFFEKGSSSSILSNNERIKYLSEE